MTVIPERDPGPDSQTTRVTVVLPEGREHIWTSSDSALSTWEVGQVVTFRSGRWRVLGREADLADVLTLRLGPHE